MKEILLALLLAAACAAPRAEKQRTSPGLVVGRSDSGQLLLAATHYDAMNGQALAEDDSGVACSQGALLCKRETLTGTHFPSWICRCEQESAMDAQRTRDMVRQLEKMSKL